MTTRTVAVLEGDQTGQELLVEALRVLDPNVTRVPTEFRHFDLSLENRRATKNAVVREAAAAMAVTGLGLKAATITPEIKGDVGSPNAILREEIDGKVILRTGRRSVVAQVDIYRGNDDQLAATATVNFAAIELPGG